MENTSSVNWGHVVKRQAASLSRIKSEAANGKTEMMAAALAAYLFYSEPLVGHLHMKAFLVDMISDHMDIIKDIEDAGMGHLLREVPDFTYDLCLAQARKRSNTSREVYPHDRAIDGIDLQLLFDSIEDGPASGS
ncbi:MAG: hypothetical protein Q9159_000285 [Coniocarpon cinnabarinum]